MSLFAENSGFSTLALGFSLPLAASFCLASCRDTGGSSQESELFKRGRAVYVANCLSCHGSDPSMDGSIGPAVSGSSLELLKSKVLKSQYPEAYSPQRESRLMPAFPHLEADLPALAEFLKR